MFSLFLICSGKINANLFSLGCRTDVHFLWYLINPNYLPDSYDLCTIISSFVSINGSSLHILIYERKILILCGSVTLIMQPEQTVNTQTFSGALIDAGDLINEAASAEPEWRAQVGQQQTLTEEKEGKRLRGRWNQDRQSGGDGRRREEDLASPVPTVAPGRHAMNYRNEIWDKCQAFPKSGENVCATPSPENTVIMRGGGGGSRGSAKPLKGSV